VTTVTEVALVLVFFIAAVVNGVAGRALSFHGMGGAALWVAIRVGRSAWKPRFA